MREMSIKWTNDDRGHRRFTLAGRTFRAFWSTGYRRWTVLETDPTTGDNLDNRDVEARWRYPNWPALENNLPRAIAPPVPKVIDTVEAREGTVEQPIWHNPVYRTPAPAPLCERKTFGLGCSLPAGHTGPCKPVDSRPRYGNW